MPPRSEALGQALDLFTTGVDMMRRNFRRETPDASPGDVERRLTAWLRTRPGAEAGDASGRAGSLARFSP